MWVVGAADDAAAGHIVGSVTCAGSFEAVEGLTGGVDITRVGGGAIIIRIGSACAVGKGTVQTGRKHAGEG